ncbi:MAG: hypothetical protein UW35_C0003G0019 [Candidatus Collierbacteria bacterium GW2011_GWF2_44_15]|uniref:Septum formation initiator n=4 Tax=Candidatus Collieribacteriota TaxID=1752725 RepID=A0A0G1JT23_9BACT|nr:MAG: hypothetical protein UW26_C0001G0026 [Candidatus Collierbacteria bacterium GW2011_GWF1_44_12]KKT47082.1 MAG: hypothetical protein UW35_C0003G0019 [Candidatus Collierbacteria bacterium GW2011_GWF2_44_15]KKT98153.1 MAG: hypothetical protein UW99_C0025G0005 [Candidatus Collierbacteria bacterium GW2011_GWC2_45_15]
MQGVRIRHEPKDKKSWIRLAFLVLIWLLIWSLFNDFSKVRKGFLRVDESQNRLTQVKEENLELKRKMMAVQTEYYKEKLMRDKLNLQLPGETVVVLPEKDVEVVSGEAEGETEENWEKWLKIVR